MAYIDETYYNETYKGKTADAATLAVFLERATDIVDQLTGYKIALNAAGLSGYSDFIQAQVKKATAAQAEFLIISGGNAANTGAEPASVSIGSFSYSTAAPDASRSSNRTTAAVIEYLKPTGLLYSGVNTRTGEVFE
jgi:hypothetical protein